MKIMTVFLTAALALSACTSVDAPAQSVSEDEEALGNQPPVVTEMVCASQDDVWNDVTERLIKSYVCTFPTGTCTPVYETVHESVECQNTCSDPVHFYCVAYPPPPYSTHESEPPGGRSRREPARWRECAGDGSRPA